MLLQDPDLTKVLIVTTPEPTPVTEAEHLQIDLLRAGIHPWAWIINNSIAAANPESPLLQQRAHQELGQYLRITELVSLSGCFGPTWSACFGPTWCWRGRGVTACFGPTARHAGVVVTV